MVNIKSKKEEQLVCINTDSYQNKLRFIDLQNLTDDYAYYQKRDGTRSGLKSNELDSFLSKY